VDSDLKAVEDAEDRLESRSKERRAGLARRDRRRRLAPWLICLVPLPALGAGVLLAIVDDQGGDLRELSDSTAVALVAGCLLVPALISGWIGRRHGRVDAVLWALVTLAVELALVFGLGFAVLDLGP
jgi:MFS family permease